MLAAVPDIDDDIPIPASAADALPPMTPAEELQMRARTITLLSDMQGKPLSPNEIGRAEAEELARQMMQNPRMRPEYATYPNETIAYLAGLVSHVNYAIVDDLADLKTYVINKLVMEVENAKSSKDRLVALKALGDIDGVDAFKRRTETTITYKPIEQVEQELLTVLEGIEYHVQDAQDASETPKMLENGEKSPENDEISDILSQIDAETAEKQAFDP